MEVLQAEDELKAIEKKLTNGEGPEEDETRLFCAPWMHNVFLFWLSPIFC